VWDRCVEWECELVRCVVDQELEEDRGRAPDGAGTARARARRAARTARAGGAYRRGGPQDALGGRGTCRSLDRTALRRPLLPHPLPPKEKGLALDPLTPCGR